MKTYTRDEIKRIMIDRPGVVFAPTSGDIEFMFDRTGLLVERRPGIGWEGSSGLYSSATYTIPADNEKPAELPESVREVIMGDNHISMTKVVTAIWAETVKLVEGRKV